MISFDRIRRQKIESETLNCKNTNLTQFLNGFLWFERAQFTSLIMEIKSSTSCRKYALPNICSQTNLYDSNVAIRQKVGKEQLRKSP